MRAATVWMAASTIAFAAFASIGWGGEPGVEELLEEMGSAEAAVRSRAQERLYALFHRNVTAYGQFGSRDEVEGREIALAEIRRQAALLDRACDSGNLALREAARRIRETLENRVRNSLVFASTRSGGQQVHSVDAGSGAVRALTAAEDRHDWPTFSPTGDRVCFSRGDERRDLYVMNADGTNERRLTDDGRSTGRPAWSPDGSRICYVSRRGGDSELYVIPAAGGESRRLTFRKGDDFGPRWSPDGSKIAFESSGNGNREIHAVEAAGGEPKNLTGDPGIDRDPRWSPDGSRIAFTSDRDGNLEIYVMSLDGSGKVRMTESEHLDHQPSWSLDGRMLAFSSYRKTKRGDTTALCVVEARDGREILTTREETNVWAWRSEWESPHEVVFERTRELCPRHERKICVLDIRTGKERVLFREMGITCPPRFSLNPVRLDDLSEVFDR